MAVTSNTFTGDGSTTNYSFTFEYLERDEVKVTLDGTATTAFTFANATTLSFTSAPANNVEIRIYRDTDTDTLKATFFPGSAVKAEDLNDNFTQNNFAVQELKNSTWDSDTETIKSNETWESSDTQIATTAAMDARFQDEAAETITSSETWPSDDNTSATTAAIDGRIDTALTNDIAGSDGVSITDDGDGTITVGLTDSAVDLDKIKDEDKITYAEQNAGSPSPADTNIFTASAAARRFDTLVQTASPTGTDWETGKTWLQNDNDKTLSVWNGSAWLGVASGGTFTNQPKIVYVDATAGDDNADGHRISTPKATIKAAINQINADATYGDGSVVVVAPGVYQEAAPIQIQKKNVSIIGTALRSCIVHPTVATQGDHADGNHALFELNSGSFIQNLTLTGMKAGTYDSGDPNTLDSSLPKRQGWNFAFFADATITKSPYIQNCTNFSDSEIDNSDINVNNPAGGAAGDTDSAPTGGGMLVNGDAVHDDSPLRSMVSDSYTHVGLNGPGILVTNNGYAQCTSSYAFFNRYHIKALNGGQANLAASTTDFGDEALVADGKSTTAIFTSNVDGAAADGDTTFNINEPTAGSGWFGDAQRPASNMLVTVNSVTYPVLSATANTDSEGGAGWTVTISRPNSSNRSENLGLNGAISDDAAVSFFLRSMIASSGHTMEYVGSGTNYSALPENGGVPNTAKQIVESNNGKVWTAITDHNGRFAIGDFFTVDQRTGFIEFSAGSYAFDVVTDTTPELGGQLDALTNKIVNLGTPTAGTDAATKAYVDTNATGIGDVVEDTTPQLGGNLDVNGNEIVSASNGNITINPNGTGDIVLDANVGIGTSSPSEELEISSATPALKLSDTDETNSYGTVSMASKDMYLQANGASSNGQFIYRSGNAGTFTERQRIDSSGRLLVGTTSADSVGGDSNLGFYLKSDTLSKLTCVRTNSDTAGGELRLGKTKASGSNSSLVSDDDGIGRIRFCAGDGTDLNSETARIDSFVDGTPGSNDMPGRLVFSTTADGSATPSERMRINAGGQVTINTTTAQSLNGVGQQHMLVVAGSTSDTDITDNSGAAITISNTDGTADNTAGLHFAREDTDGTPHYSGASIVTQFKETQVTGQYPKADLAFLTSTAANTAPSEKVRILSSGDVGIGRSSPAAKLDVNGNYASNVTAVSALAIDCSAGNYFTKTINANSTFTFSNVPSSRAFAFTLELTHTSGTVTWPSSVKWPDDTAPTLTTGKTHLFIFVTDDGGTRFRGASNVDYVN